jgi:hypothetical protein
MCTSCKTNLCKCSPCKIKDPCKKCGDFDTTSFNHINRISMVYNNYYSPFLTLQLTMLQLGLLNK